ncbi:MAG: dihydrodipicolinate synthase family protein [Vicinamibacterales bacterium]
MVLCGSATSFYSALALGAHGGVLALAGLVPERCADLMRMMTEGRFGDARALQARLLPLARAIGAQHGVPALKAALTLAGFQTGDPRPPLRPAPAPVVDSLRRELAALGVAADAPAAP